MKHRITPEQFVRTWQAASSREEVATTLGTEVNTIDTRAAYYRKRGVPLKILPSRPRRVDWEALSLLAKNLLDEDYVEPVAFASTKAANG